MYIIYFTSGKIPTYLNTNIPTLKKWHNWHNIYQVIFEQICNTITTFSSFPLIIRSCSGQVLMSANKQLQLRERAIFFQEFFQCFFEYGFYQV